jgi:hypothetical protein
MIVQLNGILYSLVIEFRAFVRESHVTNISNLALSILGVFQLCPLLAEAGLIIYARNQLNFK